MTENQPGILFNKGDPSEPDFPFYGVADRMLTLNEACDEGGRLIEIIGTFEQNGFNHQGLPWGTAYMDSATETVQAGSVEVWQITNLTADTHPIHFHLVNVQLIQRQAFEENPSAWRTTGNPMPPDPNEVGWKETARMNPR